MEVLKAVLVNGNAFFDNCKECLYESQTNLICVTIDRVVTESSKTLKIDVDFHLESCKKEGVIGAIKDTLGSIESLLPFTEAFHIMSTSTFGVALVNLELFVPLDFYLNAVAFMTLVVDHIESNIRRTWYSLLS